MKYPRQWPGFLVTVGGQHVRRGGILEAVTIGTTHQGDNYGGFVGGRILSHGTGRATGHPVDGWKGTFIGWRAIRPLTPAARAIWNIAKREWFKGDVS